MGRVGEGLQGCGRSQGEGLTEAGKGAGGLRRLKKASTAAEWGVMWRNNTTLKCALSLVATLV